LLAFHLTTDFIHIALVVGLIFIALHLISGRAQANTRL
jgi:hypothetical protein